MNTKKVLLISSDPQLVEIIRISALTLTKLNCQVDLVVTDSKEVALQNSEKADMNMVIIGNDENTDTINLIRSIRNGKFSKSKKIILIHENEIDKSAYFNAGCDSIMRMSEFSKAVNNILVF